MSLRGPFLRFVFAGGCVAVAAAATLTTFDRVALTSADGTKPRAFRARGRVVCMAEEMKKHYGANVQPVHEHLLGFRLDGELPADTARYYTLLRTDQSEALYVDKRFSDHTLILTGRTFPQTNLLEVSGWQWYRGDQLFDVYYWCEVCSIRGFDPGLCACCQAPVELRERLAKAPAEAKK